MVSGLRAPGFQPDTGRESGEAAVKGECGVTQGKAGACGSSAHTPRPQGVRAFASPQPSPTPPRAVPRRAPAPSPASSHVNRGATPPGHRREGGRPRGLSARPGPRGVQERHRGPPPHTSTGGKSGRDARRAARRPQAPRGPADVGPGLAPACQDAGPVPERARKRRAAGSSR